MKYRVQHLAEGNLGDTRTSILMKIELAVGMAEVVSPESTIDDLDTEVNFLSIWWSSTSEAIGKPRR
jgi:hypothetical protein